MEFAIGRYIYRDGDDVFADGSPFCFDDFVGAFGVGWILFMGTQNTVQLKSSILA